MSPPPSIGLRQWIWRAFLQSALVPLILVEAVLIAIYLLTNAAIRDAQIEHLRETALTDLQSAASQETRVIDEQLGQIGSLTELYRKLTTNALSDPTPLPPAKLALNQAGARYSPQDLGGAASFYSAVTAAERQDLSKVARLSRLDPLMKEIQTGNPLVASVYFNSWDSYNHIYPWFLTPEQYPQDIVIPSFNFYYLADATHNPTRDVTWTGVYLDPAGQGWMMSAVAPVYRDDFLEGVVGIDVTVDRILQRIDQIPVPWGGYAMLVSGELNIMALPAAGEADFALRELTSHSYEDAIRREIFKPEDFNLARRSETRELARAIAHDPQGVRAVNLGGRPQLVAWSTIPQTGWHLLTVVDEAAVFQQTNSLAGRYQQIGYLLIAGLVLFYLVFFALMWLRARNLSEKLRAPIAGIYRMMVDIGAGNRRPQRVDSHITELSEVARRVENTALQLETSEEQRLRAQQRLELVVDSATEGLWEQDQASGEMLLRGRFCKHFGLPMGVISEAAFVSHVHPDDVARLSSARLLIDDFDGLYEAEFRFRSPQGDYRWLLARGRVIERDEQTGQAARLAGTYVNIDALKQTEADLRRATYEAQAASRAKSRFISSMSHELRTPLNAIHGFTQLMQIDRQKAGDRQHLAYLDEILMASRHLNQLVGDVLDWASIQSEAPRLNLRAVNIRPLLLECAEMVRLEAKSQGLQLEMEPIIDGLSVLAEPRRLRQVLLNLLSNAIKYNRPSGRIILGCRPMEKTLRLTVTDTGLGIPVEDQPRLFEPFQRLGRENSAIQGTGIGLSLCQEYARLMGGHMGMHSEAGQGSSFWIELPRLQATPAPGKIAPEYASLQARICLIESDPQAQQRLAGVLQSLGEVRIESDAANLTEKLAANPPDLLVIRDCHEIEGLTLRDHLQRQSKGRKLPLLVLGESRPAPLFPQDCTLFIPAPLSAEEIRARVAFLLKRVS